MWEALGMVKITQEAEGCDCEELKLVTDLPPPGSPGAGSQPCTTQGVLVPPRCWEC